MLSVLFISAFVAFTVLGVRLKRSSAGGFPSGLVGKTLHFTARGTGSTPGLGNNLPRAVQCR